MQWMSSSRWAGSSALVFLVAATPWRQETSSNSATPPAESLSDGGKERAVRAGLTAGEWSSIRDAYEAGRHAAFAVEDGYGARSPGQQWVTRFDGRGFTITPEGGEWTWGLELVSYGFSGAERAIEAPVAARAEGARVAYVWDETLEEWYVNERRGLEHGYTLRERPPRGANDADGEEPLTLTLALRGGLRPEGIDDGRGVRFLDENGVAVLNYAALVVLDQEGKKVPARLAQASEGIQILVDDRSASYPLTIDPLVQQAYVKAPNTGFEDFFGFSISVSGDTAVVGAFGEDGGARGVTMNWGLNNAPDSGAVYVFVRDGTNWSQQAYIKASNTGIEDWFGISVSISGDTLVVGAPHEDSAATGVGTGGLNNNAPNSGAAYVFVRNGTTWSQQAYVKASNTETFDEFGTSVAISGDTAVIGAYHEGSDATGVNGTQTNNNADDSGAAYVFVRTGTSWSQQAYLKASNTNATDVFGFTVSVSDNTAVIGAPLEDSNATGVNGIDTDNSLEDSGAAYVFVRTGATWSQQAYLKASNADAVDWFGYDVSVSLDTAVVSALGESSSATGVNGNQNGNGAPGSGAAYVFVVDGTTWSQQAYVKASNTEAYDGFGYQVSISGDWMVASAPFEDSDAIGVNGDQYNENRYTSGAAYVFVRSGSTWTQHNYLKASNTDYADEFGCSVSISGFTVVVGAPYEDSNATGIDGDGSINDIATDESGAAYFFTKQKIFE